LQQAVNHLELSQRDSIFLPDYGLD
jgi:hypothetical protein